MADALHIEVDLSAVTRFPEADMYEAVTFVNLGSNSSPKATQRAADIARKGEQLIETIWGMQYYTRTWFLSNTYLNVACQRPAHF